MRGRAGDCARLHGVEAVVATGGMEGAVDLAAGRCGSGRKQSDSVVASVREGKRLQVGCTWNVSDDGWRVLDGGFGFAAVPSVLYFCSTRGYLFGAASNWNHIKLEIGQLLE